MKCLRTNVAEIEEDLLLRGGAYVLVPMLLKLKLHSLIQRDVAELKTELFNSEACPRLPLIP